MNTQQQALAESKGRQRASMIQQIERQQARESEEFKSRMVATLPKRMADRAINEWSSCLRNIGDTEANLWLQGIGALAASA